MLQLKIAGAPEVRTARPSAAETDAEGTVEPGRSLDEDGFHGSSAAQLSLL